MIREMHQISGFYWLIPPAPERGGLAGMARPRDPAALPALQIGLLVSLMEYAFLDGGMPPGLRRIHLPIRNDGVLSEAQFPQLAVACALMHRWRLQRGPLSGVGVHCLYGQGRTGMLLACYQGYLLVRHPADPDARSPDDTSLEIGRLLHELTDEPGSGPRAHQVRCARWFVAWLEQNPDMDFDAASAQELDWQRLTPVATDPQTLPKQALPKTAWQCSNEDCLSLAVHVGGADAPRWCPSCGQASN